MFINSYPGSFHFKQQTWQWNSLFSIKLKKKLNDLTQSNLGEKQSLDSYL